MGGYSQVETKKKRICFEIFLELSQKLKACKKEGKMATEVDIRKQVYYHACTYYQHSQYRMLVKKMHWTGRLTFSD